MYGGVGRVHELARDKAVGDLLGQLVGLGDSALHALCALGQHQLRAVSLHQLAALHAHGLRHDDDDTVAAGGGHGRQTDAGITGSRLDDDGIGLQQTLLLRVVDHSLGNTILHAAGRVEVFQLAQHLGLQALFLFNVSQLQQRSLTDQLVSGCIDLAHNYIPPK